MSIIYSYPTTSPTLDDLLIGTDVGEDNATKSFTVQSLVSLVNAAQNNGILTSVTISTDAFLTAVGNPTGPAVAYTIGLAATGTPSATTFLRGDNQWVVPTVSAGISVLQDNITVTNDVQGFNFTGLGVSVNDLGSGLVNINIDGASNLVTSVSAGIGISIAETTGNVVVSNDGIVSISQGIGILATTVNGVTTISTTGQSSGTVISVQPGLGLQLEGTGLSTVNPVIGINYSGNENFIVNGLNSATALPEDQILFNQDSSNIIKSTTFGEIQASTLELVNTSITTSDADNIKNDTDVSPFSLEVPRVNHVITLTQATYDGLVTAGTTESDTLYLTKAGAAPTAVVLTHTITNSISGAASLYNISSTVASGSTRSAAPGTIENWTTSVALTNPSGYYWSVGPTISPSQPESVTYTSNATITTSIAGTISVIQPNQCTAYLGGQNGTSGSGIGATASLLVGSTAVEGANEDYTITYGNANNAATSNCTGNYNPQAVFPVTFALTTGITGRGDQKYTLTGLNYNYSSTSTTYGSASPTCDIIGTLALKTFTINYAITDNINSNNGADRGTEYTLLTSSTGAGFSGAGVTFVEETLTYGTQYNVATTASAVTPGFAFTSAPVFTQTGDPTSSGANGITSNVNIALTITGTTAVAQGTVLLGDLTNNITLNSQPGVAAGYGYVINYRIRNSTQTLQNWTTVPYSGTTFLKTFSAVGPTDIGNFIDITVGSESSTGYTFNSGPSLSFDGNNYTPLPYSPETVISTTTIVSGQTNLPTSTLTGNVITNPSSYFRTIKSASSGVVCSYNAVDDVLFWYNKASGNTSFYPQQNDIAYSNSDGTTLLPTGYYAMRVDETTGTGTGTTVRSQVYVNGSGIIGAPSAC